MMSITHKIDINGNKYWYKDGLSHRDDDLPAIEYYDGSKYWYKDGKYHREDNLPAIEYCTGAKYWYKDGKIHRDHDLPAAEYVSGGKEWHKDGKFHRDGDLPTVVYSNGDQLWYKYGLPYEKEKIEHAYRILQNQCRRFRGYLWRKKLRYKQAIHKELLCRPARGNFPGGLHYQEMVASL